MTVKKSLVVLLLGGLGLVALTSWGVKAYAEAPRSFDGLGAHGVESPIQGDRPLGRFIMKRLAALRSLRWELGITDEQRAELREIRAKHRDEMVPLIKEVVNKRRALRNAVLAENPDEQAIRQAADALGKAIGDVAVAGSSIAAEAKGILSDEQMAILRQHRSDRESDVDALLDGVPAE